MVKQPDQPKNATISNPHNRTRFTTDPTPMADAGVRWTGNRSGNVKALSHDSKAWRCTHCDKLLGICRDKRLHLRIGRNHQYVVGFPVQATCRKCGTLNEIGRI